MTLLHSGVFAAHLMMHLCVMWFQMDDGISMGALFSRTAWFFLKLKRRPTCSPRCIHFIMGGGGGRQVVLGGAAIDNVAVVVVVGHRASREPRAQHFRFSSSWPFFYLSNISPISRNLFTLKMASRLYLAAADAMATQLQTGLIYHVPIMTG